MVLFVSRDRMGVYFWDKKPKLCNGIFVMAKEGRNDYEFMPILNAPIGYSFFKERAGIKIRNKSIITIEVSITKVKG